MSLVLAVLLYVKWVLNFIMAAPSHAAHSLSILINQCEKQQKHL